MDEPVEILVEQRQCLLETCVKLARFCVKNQLQFDDPVSSSLTRMIREEQSISHKQESSQCNQRLTAHLRSFQDEYEQLINATCGQATDEPLSEIFESLRSIIDRVPMVKVQIDAIKNYQQHFITSNGHNAEVLTSRF